MKKLYVTALMVGAVIFGLLLVGCADDTDNGKTVTSTFQASRVWHQSGSAVLDRSAITENKLTLQDSGQSGFSKVVLTVNGLTQVNGTMVTLVGGGATPDGGTAEIGLFPEGGDFTGNGIRFAQDESDASFPSSFQKAVANSSVSFTFWYQATDLSGWSTSSTFADSDVPREVAFRLETSDGNNTIFTAEESGENYYIGGVGEDNTATLTINLGGTVAYSLQTVNKDIAASAATFTDGAATDNGGNIRLNLNITGIDTGLAGSQLAAAGTTLRYEDGSNYTAESWFNNTPNEGLRCTISSTGTCDLTVFWDPDDANKGGDGMANQDYSTWTTPNTAGALFVVKLNLITSNSTVESFIYPTDSGQYIITTDDTPDHTSGIYGGNATIDAGDTITVAVSLGD